MAHVPGVVPKRSYSREEVCRLLSVREGVLEQWEAHGFLEPTRNYGFSELVALKTLHELRAKRVRPERIKLILESLRAKLRDVRDPLSELKIFTDGRRLSVQVDGNKMEPISGQLLLDFDREELRRLLQFPGKRAADTKMEETLARQRESVKWFERGVQMEQAGAPPEAILGAYRKALENDPAAPGPHVNIGTIHFHLKQWKDAESHYRRALELKPEYALAHFNLGNLFDELDLPEQALECYLSALKFSPDYADAHFNVALVYQGRGETLNAVRHWRAYLKLDGAGYWAGVARRELSKLREEAVVAGGKP